MNECTCKNPCNYKSNFYQFPLCYKKSACISKKYIDKHSNKAEALWVESLVHNEQDIVKAETLNGEKSQAVLSFYND